ncbi:MAG: DUF1345 domain-containing protein [Ferruginibacter sp.]|nr:DUF1345 domain-containing protein [Ferruginibacter sp.]
MTNHKPSKNNHDNIFLRMHPVHRIGISLVFAAVTFFALEPQNISALLQVMASWVVFSACFIITSWVVLFTRPIPEIRKKAVADDGSAGFVYVMVLVSSFASMFAVLLLMISKQQQGGGHWFFIPVSIGGMLLSWTMVHTVFTFHYAHKYYDNDEDEPSKAAEGLDFPGGEKPDYIDFAYFSFIIGCTFQVSDIQVTSRKIRRIVLLHGLLSFALNAFVVALTINFIASLIN